MPRCNERWAHRHHIVRRSATGGPKRYVSVDGLVLPNLMGICMRHHDQVTGMVGGHWAKICFPSIEELAANLYKPLWMWYARLPSPNSDPYWQLLGPIDDHVYI